jgi:hypothetical protein
LTWEGGSCGCKVADREYGLGDLVDALVQGRRSSPEAFLALGRALGVEEDSLSIALKGAWNHDSHSYGSLLDDVVTTLSADAVAVRELAGGAAGSPPAASAAR